MSHPLSRRPAALLLPALALLALADPAAAHAPGSAFAGFPAGVLHPLLGWDHLLAMLGVGIWGARLERGGFALPLVFPAMLAVGAVFGYWGAPMAGVETGIALSILVLGLFIAFVVQLPATVAILLTGLFALFHGYAHGAEMPHDTAPLGFGVGIVLSTLCLHLLGYQAARRMTGPKTSAALRIAGLGAAGLGGAVLLGIG